MLKKTIKYTDYNGVERTEDFYFNLNKAELTEMELAHPGGFTVYLERIAQVQDSVAMGKVFKDLILKSYGVKSDDGKRFIKNISVTEDFLQTEAYSELFMELLSGTEHVLAFVNGILPPVPKEAVPAPTNLHSV